jgi:hypothetical protein
VGPAGARPAPFVGEFPPGERLTTALRLACTPGTSDEIGADAAVARTAPAAAMAANGTSGGDGPNGPDAPVAANGTKGADRPKRPRRRQSPRTHPAPPPNMDPAILTVASTIGA